MNSVLARQRPRSLFPDLAKFFATGRQIAHWIACDFVAAHHNPLRAANRCGAGDRDPVIRHSNGGSATDALQFEKLTQVTDWSTDHLACGFEKYIQRLWNCEKHPEVKSPYLRSYSNHYTRGKYVADCRPQART